MIRHKQQCRSPSTQQRIFITRQNTVFVYTLEARVGCGAPSGVMRYSIPPEKACTVRYAHARGLMNPWCAPC